MDMHNINKLKVKWKEFELKTQIEEINRNIYDIKNKDEYVFKVKKGFTPEIIEEISKLTEEERTALIQEIENKKKEGQ